MALPDERRAKVLKAGMQQVLWALMLVYLALLGIGALFGRQVGYALSFSVCGGIAGLATVSFLVIYLVDRGSAGLIERWGIRKGGTGRDGHEEDHQH